MLSLMVLTLLSCFSSVHAYATETGTVTLCDTRPAIVNDPTAPNEYATVITPDVSDPSQCQDFSTPIDWSIPVPLEAPFYNNLTYVITPADSYCVAFVDENCEYDADADPNTTFQMSCIGDRPGGEAVELFYIREEAYYQGEQLKCIACGPKDSGAPNTCHFE